ncbi:glycosyltransferase [Alginatibacterium sediminis]|uniref:Glycosyltransferase n=1 Tax=Alginatibacterium sediminis TaxID=2164068 RepID=A0A420E6G3_9ALTE|nr:glycosyltransferase family 4 protein [Alginatibacterium sediminis]RKF13746.1 glycosyltransferase [Alginatibacterium sediminis]
MNILLAHFRVGETDGVSLEMDKWKWALQKLGHQVFYLAGSAGSCEAEMVPQLHYLDPFNDTIIHNAYVERCDFNSDDDLLIAIEQQAKLIASGISEVITRLNIDIVVPNNMWSLGYHLPAALGLLQAVEQTQTRVVCHHHDFHWERVKYSQPTGPGVAKLLETHFPPKNPLVQHCVINRIAQHELMQRRGIEATVVPNVFDFAGSDWRIDDYNSDLRQRFGIRPNDVMFLQATRVVARKGIELAIDLLAQLNSRRQEFVGKTLYNAQTFEQDSRFVLCFAGLCEEPAYLTKLLNKAQVLGVELVIMSDAVEHSRDIRDGQNVYSLWDVYTQADMITYPSLLEGWGNQFLEGLVAKLPMAVYRYPVYDLDINDYKFNIIDLGRQHQIDEQGLAYIDPQQTATAVHETIKYLFDAQYRKEMVNQNYNIGEKALSYTALRTLLAKVFAR